MSSTPSLSVIHDTRRARKDKTYPVKLRIIYKRKPLLISLKITLSENDFEKILGSGRVNEELQKHRITIEKAKSKASEIIGEIKPFTLQRFKDRYDAKTVERKSSKTIADAFEAFIQKLQKSKSYKYASSIKGTVGSIKNFWGKMPDFEDVTADWLNDYEQWMRDERGNSITTIGIHTKNLRTVYNFAIYKLKIVSMDYYPFGKGGYTVPSSLKSKTFLDKEELKKLYYLKVEEGSPRQFYKDLYFFSYFCNGIYLKDIARLKYADIKDNRIEVFRTKIVNTKRIGLKSNIILINDKSKQIIERWGNQPSKPDTYIFPIYEQDMTVEEQEKKIDSFRSSYNKRLKAMAKECGITKNITSSIARHSFSYNLFASGESKDTIGELLAHSNSRTTEHYLYGLPTSERERTLQKLDVF
jgi:integrase/recombinase XerD